MMYLPGKDLIRDLFFFPQDQLRRVDLFLGKRGLLFSYMGSKPNYALNFFGSFPGGMHVVCSGEPEER